MSVAPVPALFSQIRSVVHPRVYRQIVMQAVALLCLFMVATLSVY